MHIVRTSQCIKLIEILTKTATNDIPVNLLNKYLSGYPYIIHNIYTKRKNIIDKMITNDALSVILNFCIDSEHYREFCYFGYPRKKLCSNNCLCRIDLVCKKWSKIIGPNIKKIQSDVRISIDPNHICDIHISFDSKKFHKTLWTTQRKKYL